ncbi:MAG: hypothetical protein RR505_05890, partial [Raoultibacter sp.]
MIFDRSKTTVAHRGTSIASKVGALMLAVLLCLGSSPHSARAETEGTALSTQVTSTATDTTSAAAEASQATAPNPTIESPKGA